MVSTGVTGSSKTEPAPPRTSLTIILLGSLIYLI